ncbi:hypothetical protein ACLOJK_041024 [Asimina triloba]
MLLHRPPLQIQGRRLPSRVILARRQRSEESSVEIGSRVRDLGAPQPVPRKRGASPVRLALRKRMRKNLEVLFFGGPLEFLPCLDGQSTFRLLQSLLERDMKGRSTPFLMVPEAIFVRQEGILKGYLRAGSFNATYTDETF